MLQRLQIQFQNYGKQFFPTVSEPPNERMKDTFKQRNSIIIIIIIIKLLIFLSLL